jgi:hypothetical protein
MKESKKASDDASTITAAIESVTATRDGYAAFLRCREYQQLATGITLVGLTGGALGLAAAGIHEVTAAALGAAAGTGVGLNYVVYNKHKTMAYANAVAQLQCVIEKGENADNFSSDGITKLAEQLQTRGKELSDMIPSQCAADPLWQGVVVRKSILQGKLTSKRAMWNETTEVTRILAVRRLIDVRAFAAAQEGVPDGNRIKSALEAVAVPIPEFETTDTAARTTDAAAKTILALAAELAKAREEKKQKSPCDSRPEVVQAANTVIDAIEKAVDAIEIPDFAYEACLDGPGEFASDASSDEEEE